MPYNYTTLGGIAYEELEGSPVYRATSDGFAATQMYRMPWGSIDAFLLESFPLPVRGGFAYEYTLERTFPGVAWLFTRSVHIEPFVPEKPSPGAQFNTYPTGAKVTIEYGTRPREKQDGTLRTHRMSIGGEAMILPVGAFGWELDQLPGEDFSPIQYEDVRVAKIVPMIEQSLSFEYVPDPPFTTIAATIGMVNSTNDLFGAQPETLLFLGADANRRLTPQGEDAWKLEYRFSQRIIKGRIAGALLLGYEDDAIGWNHFFHQGDKHWEKIETPDGDNVYETADFGPLFQPEGGGEA